LYNIELQKVHFEQEGSMHMPWDMHLVGKGIARIQMGQFNALLHCYVPFLFFSFGTILPYFDVESLLEKVV
jgi:hypothetical protein